MEVDNGDSIRCCCDPLKRVLREVFCHVDVCDDKLIRKLHSFYKSSVIRFGAGTGRGTLECRVGEETFKSLREWLTDNGRRLKGDLMNFENLNCLNLERVETDSFGNATLCLDLDKMKGEVVRWMMNTGWKGYSREQCHNQIYHVEIAMNRVAASDAGENSLLEYRKVLVAQAVSTILKKIGHLIDEARYSCISPDVNIQKNNSVILIAGTPLSVAEVRVKNSDLIDPEVVLRADVGPVLGDPPGVQEMLSKRLAEIKEIGEARRLENLLLSSWATSLDNLTRATLNYDLLYRPLEADIKLGSLSESGQMNNSNIAYALFIMYNYSRILSILRKFSEQVETGEYPQLPTLEQVDFSRLCEREEELRLLQLLMEWPRVMESAIIFVRFQLSLEIICKFLLTLAKAFNAFYFQIVVLVPTNASHNFATMMARVYLIKAVCLVFEDCLEILQVNHASL